MPNEHLHQQPSSRRLGGEALPHLRRAYRADTEPVLRQRLDVAVGLFVLFMGIGTVVEVVSFPQRATRSVFAYAVEVVAGVLALGACRMPRIHRWPDWIGGTLIGVLTALITGYHASVAAQAERLAMVLLCVLNMVAVLIPWGWGAQTVPALSTLAAFGLALPYLTTAGHDAPLISFVTLMAGATISVCGAFYLDRHRFEAFRRTALHAEEAQIAETLVHVSETLSASLDRPDMIERVNNLAVETLGCDFSSAFLYDMKRGVYRLAANVGSLPEVRTELAQIEFPPDSLPLLQVMRPGEIVEVQDGFNTPLVPGELMRRMEVASALYTPIARGERIIGVLVNGYRVRSGPFSRRQWRLSLGIAHATAIALENSRLVADLQAASRLKSDFVATMSHELRTPLNVILGYTEMLADESFAPFSGNWRDTVGRVQQSALELMELVSATLDLNRLDAGHDAVVAGRVDVEALFAELAREVEPLVGGGVALRWDGAAAVGTVVTDRVKLKTVLKNLVGNALKFTAEGTVDVNVRVADGTLVLQVRDTGIGIEAAHLPVIFEMFRQIDSSSTRRFGGVGLGLYIVRRLVGVLGGTIDVVSAPRVGSTFTVTIPVSEATGIRATGT
jgi:signal transduction histidine kinase